MSYYITLGIHHYPINVPDRPAVRSNDIRILLKLHLGLHACTPFVEREKASRNLYNEGTLSMLRPSQTKLFGNLLDYQQLTSALICESPISTQTISHSPRTL